MLTIGLEKSGKVAKTNGMGGKQKLLHIDNCNKAVTTIKKGLQSITLSAIIIPN